jgi:hypothetical protein
VIIQVWYSYSSFRLREDAVNRSISGMMDQKSPYSTCILRRAVEVFRICLMLKFTYLSSVLLDCVPCLAGRPGSCVIPRREGREWRCSSKNSYLRH